MKKFLMYTNSTISLVTIFLAVITFIIMIVDGYQGNVLPKALFHTCGASLVIGVFTLLNSIHLGDKQQ